MINESIFYRKILISLKKKERIQNKNPEALMHLTEQVFPLLKSWGNVKEELGTLVKGRRQRCVRQNSSVRMHPNICVCTEITQFFINK